MTLPSCIITVFILFATLSKIGIPIKVKKTAFLFPLILISLLGSLSAGLTIYKSHSTSWDISLSPVATEKCSIGIVYLSILFLLFLLPHVVSLEQAALCKLTIFLFSSLIFYQVFGSTVTILHCLLLMSIILPCNTIPLFLISKYVQAGKVFYCLISQESLLSNAVSLILYHLISGKNNLDESPAQPVDWHSIVMYVLAVGIEGTVFSFFLSCLLFTLTKHCSPNTVCIVEAISLFVMSILAYYSVHFFQLPAILELTLCGICLRQYADVILLSGSSFTTPTANGSTKVTSLLKLLACICESCILALVLAFIPGQAPTLFSSFHSWNSAFVLISLFIGINCTSLGLICICWWSSKHSQPGLLEHFIVYCSALRGLYAFSLALLLSETDLSQKHLMVTSLFAFIFFAVFVQSLTLKVLQNSLKDRIATKQELISSEKLKKNLLDHIFTGFKDVTGLFGYHVLREGASFVFIQIPTYKKLGIGFVRSNLLRIHLYTSVLSRNILMRDHDAPTPSDRRMRLLQLVRKLNLRAWLQHVTVYGEAGSSSSANTSTPSLPPPATAAAIGAFTCAQASLTISSAGSRGNGTGVQQKQSSQQSSSQSNIGHISATSGRRRTFTPKIWGTKKATEFHSKPFVPNCAEHERCCGEDSGVMVDDHSEEEEEDDSHITSSSALGACCGSASCTGVEGTKFADDCRIHHIVDHNAYRPRHKWSKLNKKNPSSRQSNYAVFHQELCMQLEKLCSNRPSRKNREEDGQKLACLDQWKKCEVEGYLKNINEEIDDPSSRYLLTTPKQQRDVSGSDEEGDNLEQVAEVETAGLKDNTEDAEDSHDFHYRLPWLDETHTSPPRLQVEETIAEKTLPWKCHLDIAKAPIAEAEVIETEQTLAETTLPWKRQSTREPIFAAMSLNVVEDEPQAAEAPSWINNLLYHRLRDSGSPYMSPEDTLTLVQNTVSRPSIFSVFPAEKKPEEVEVKEKDSTSVTTAGRLLPPPLAAEVEPESISLPPPWESHNSAEYEPLTSPHATNTNIGDKVCSTESMHRLLPPTHHIIIPLTPGNTNESISDLESAAAIDRVALRSPASAPNFPTHWQMLLPALRDRRHSTSLTEEQAYEEDCLQRVQNWLDNVEPGLDGVVDLDNFEEQHHFFLLDEEDHLDDTYDADLEDEDLEETIV
ncbi:SLC9A3 [Acanthosepion pharaonis]|uniref:SLC9A3 n=1 Tax=Acanthosepion pharaonis TaxID=158019 RepID=A0A812C510_ACAPH|nr:SLC9A3 [Sepia pharaonis]